MEFKEIGNNWTALFPNTTTNASTGTTTEPVIFIGTKNKEFDNDGDTRFKVSSNGSVFFHGGISGWSMVANNGQGGFKPGFSEGKVRNLWTQDGSSITIEICQGLIVDIQENV